MKNKEIFLSILIGFLLYIGINNLNASTAFIIDHEGKLVAGYTMSFPEGYGYISVNQRNVKKKALIITPEQPSEWVSKYGSVTFNLVGCEFPDGGINEKGLVIINLWLNKTQYPAIDERPAINEVQWVQYHLDNSATIDDVINSDSKIRIGQIKSELHYILSDKEGNKAVIEFIEGKMVYHRNEDFPFHVVANDTYERSVNYLKKHKEYGGEEDFKSRQKSLDRFARTVKNIDAYNSEDSISLVDYSFQILDSVRQPGYEWQTIYDITDGILYFRTRLNEEIKHFPFAAFDFSCNDSIKILDINCLYSGEVRDRFNNFTVTMNEKHINKLFNSVDFLKEIPEELRMMLIEYPETTRCGY